MSEQEFERLIKRHLTNVSKTVANEQQWYYAGHVDGDDQYKTFVSRLNALGYSFYTKNSRRHRSSRVFCVHKHGDLQVPYIGAPFVIVKTSYLLCSKDGNYNPSKLQSLTKAGQTSEDVNKTRFLFQPTKKVGCKAFMTVKCIKVFDEDCYKLDGPYKETSRQKNKVFRKLNKDLLSSSPPTGRLRFIIHLSPAREHNHSFVSTNQNPKLHPRLENEIRRLVTERNICTLKPMKTHLRGVVRAMFEATQSQPDGRNRYYFPMNHVLRSHIHRVLFSIEESEVESWKREYPQDSFFFRPGQVPIGNNETLDLQKTKAAPSTFIFCHQAKWQRDLLSRHTNDISLLDATYKTCRYNLPLYFIAVKTNFSYCVVGTLVIQSESEELLEEALSQFRIWNPDWNPKYFMTDYSKAEISAVENVFPESTVYLSARHREQSWSRWLGKTKNVHKEVVAPLRELWESIAASLTEEEYKTNLVVMFDSDVYQDSDLARAYFSKEWLPNRHRWVKAFLTQDFLSTVVVSRNKSLEHGYLKHAKDRTLSSVMKVILEIFLPDIFLNYSSSNAFEDLHSEIIPTSAPSGNDIDLVPVPEFFKNRSVSFIETVMVRLEKGKQIDPSQICEMGSGLFLVRSNSSSEWHTVDFQNAACSCSDLNECRLPCEHMCAVIVSTDWGLEKLPTWYREDPPVIGGLAVDEQGQPSSLIIFNDEGTFREECVTAEEIDVDQLREEFRAGARTLLEYSYLEHSPEDVLRFAVAMRSLRDDMLSSASEYTPSSDLVERTRLRYSNVPGRSRSERTSSDKSVNGNGGLDGEWPLFGGAQVEVNVQDMLEDIEMDAV